MGKATFKNQTTKNQDNVLVSESTFSLHPKVPVQPLMKSLDSYYATSNQSVTQTSVL